MVSYRETRPLIKRPGVIPRSQLIHRKAGTDTERLPYTVMLSFFQMEEVPQQIYQVPEKDVINEVPQKISIKGGQNKTRPPKSLKCSKSKRQRARKLKH